MRTVPSSLVALASALAVLPLAAQDPAAPEPPAEGVAFRVFDTEGRASSVDAILRAVDQADVLLVGEQHDDMVGHGVETLLLGGTIERFDVGPGESGRIRPVVLSMEMFERDVQVVVDEYLAGLISEDHFLASARPWDHYESRYRPIVELAREREVPIVAANAPRRYVNRVTRLGPESLAALSSQARSWLPPLPYPLASEPYRGQFEAVMAEAREAMREAADSTAGEVAEDEGDAPPDHGVGHALDAQALWDASMGQSIARALQDHPGAIVVHLAGSFHVERGTGIPERIETYRPGARVVAVVMLTAEAIDAWDPAEHEGLGDFVVLTQAPDTSADATGR